MFAASQPVGRVELTIRVLFPHFSFLAFQQAGFHASVLAEASVWSIVLHELVRLQAGECEERAVLLDRARHRLLCILSEADMWLRQASAERVAIEVICAGAVCARPVLVNLVVACTPRPPSGNVPRCS